MPTPRAQSAGTATIDPARAQLVDAARTAWIGRLMDLSRRNNLLFYRPVPTSSIDLTTQNPGLLGLLAGRSVTGAGFSTRASLVFVFTTKARNKSVHIYRPVDDTAA